MIDNIMSRLPDETTMVIASSQYHLGLIITDSNKIVFRNDGLSHAEREAIAMEINFKIKQT